MRLSSSIDCHTILWYKSLANSRTLYFPMHDYTLLNIKQTNGLTLSSFTTAAVCSSVQSLTKCFRQSVSVVDLLKRPSTIFCQWLYLLE